MHTLNTKVAAVCHLTNRRLMIGSERGVRNEWPCRVRRQQRHVHFSGHSTRLAVAWPVRQMGRRLVLGQGYSCTCRHPGWLQAGWLQADWLQARAPQGYQTTAECWGALE